MKLTKQRLKAIIKEELEDLNPDEPLEPHTGALDHQSARAHAIKLLSRERMEWNVSDVIEIVDSVLSDVEADDGQRTDAWVGIKQLFFVG